MMKKSSMLFNRKTAMSVGEQRRADLLDIAQKVFLEKGFEAATINDILAAATLSKGGFYHHFKSKDDVLNALRIRYTQQFLEAVEGRMAALPGEALEEKFQTWIAAYVDAYFSSHAVHDLVYHSVHASRADADRQAITRSLENLLQQGIDRGIWRLSSASFTATIIYSAIHGVVDEIIAAGDGGMDHLAERLHASLRLLLNV